IAREALRVRVAVSAEEREIEQRERATLRVAIPPEALRVLVRALDLVVAVLDEARVDVGVDELLEERRRETDGHAVRDAGVAEVVQQAEKRQVGPEDRLVDPLLAVGPAAGATRVRQVRMEDEREGVGHLRM